MVSAPWINPQDTYRDDIQGVRAIGAILIALYHIWIHKVSGGVDVFFVMSGFLMTGVLIRQLESTNRIQPFVFWGNLVKRIAPSACTVLLATLFLGYFFVPEPLWSQFIKEVTFSALQIENIGLMRNSVDYLARELPPSPVQQFWALSIQVQFYVFLPLILALVLGLSKRPNSTLPFITAIAVVIAASFLYSVVETTSNPVSAYFNPGARAWEFFAGVLLAFLLPYLQLNAALRNALGLIGISALLLCGILVSESMKFPGYIAIIPVTAAVLLIISGAGSSQTPAKRLLSHPWLKALGKVSFGIYLWHWPLLAFTIEYTGNSHLSLPLGLAIILLAVVLAMATNRYIEEPIRKKKYQAGKAWAPYLIGGAFLTPVLATAATWSYYIQSTIASQSHYNLQQAIINDVSRPDERQDASHIPHDELVTVKELLPDAYTDGCHQDITSPEVRICTYGDRHSQASVALVGGSHAAQWLPALDTIGKQGRLKILNITKSSCPLGALPDSDPSCMEWNRQLVEELSLLKPLAVITNSTRATLAESPEHVPPSYVQQWKKLESLGIKVIAIRDNPAFDFDAATCVARHPEDALACAKPREQSLSSIDPSIAHLRTLSNLNLIDMSEFFCTQRTCMTVTNDHLMYRDAEHLNVLYVLSLTNELHEKLARTSPDIFPPTLIVPRRPTQSRN
ncbi:Peptidoglycan/LPS O-acetylase OafA/YrhL, contains acyltransferase and SGNH-hydrolase domains [Geopseudomonas sagittaria]|uniref:Peptidoglycan/LPS O-acetylase OafA/YrhL, contains acyltransferase and SGNH-hydrolase domains n=1 Tax=Geopseudomonas sagittaria TaxID=1135990 RepID=A0A1I5YD99_9GAMM|nr:acyltransferase family protein [Pseudomonas sagittaria]SFQ41877.1 Peptidoglycan/LPS O-acetylase OafA/YrhL, contains acyltransferase and SGNH-hydrolase domains [Pseudomonas sagittaria]